MKKILSVMILVAFFIISFFVINYSCKEIHLYGDYAYIECPIITFVIGIIPLIGIYGVYYFSKKHFKKKYLQVLLLIILVCYPLFFLSATKSCSMRYLFKEQLGDWCWNDIAEKNNDLTYCDKIKGGQRDHCYMKVSVNTNNLEACEKISHSNYKKYCIGVLTKNESLCNEITDGKYAGECASRI